MNPLHRLIHEDINKIHNICARYMDLTFMIYMVITFKDYDKVACVAYQLFQYMLFD